MKTLFLFLAVLLVNTAFAQIQPSESNDLDAAKYRIVTEEEREALAQKGLHVVSTHDNGLPANYRFLTEEERLALLKHKELTIVSTYDNGLPDNYKFADEETIQKLVDAGYWDDNQATKTCGWADGQGSMNCDGGTCRVVYRTDISNGYAIACQKKEKIVEICCDRVLDIK